MGAVEPEPEKREPQRYRVEAPTAVLGYESGTTFTELLDPTQEARLLTSGALRKLGPAQSSQGRPTGRKATDKKE